MNHPELVHALDVIHRQLSDSDHLDPDEVEKLRVTMREIQSALDQQEHHDRLSDRISQSARKFEESHPVLTENLGRVADMLQQMGF